MINLQGKTVLVTGGTGFLGKHVLKRLEERGALTCYFSRQECDLTKLSDVRLPFLVSKPDYVIHCAGFNGGIVYNRKYPYEIFYKNAQMGLNIIETCKEFKVKKVISVMTSCSYPDTDAEILKEEEFYNGRPNPSIECHGLAKRVLEAASRFANQQYSFPAYSVAITNLYGPGDTFDLERTKVVGALIHRFVTAKQENIDRVVCLGTGNPRREFMFVRDAAEALVRSLELYEDASIPLNIGVGSDTSIASLALLIKNIVGYEGDVIWDTSAGDGQMKKLLDTTRMRSILNYEPETPLDVGLEETIRWYINNQK